jgi:biotin carboxyl carrier protein
MDRELCATVGVDEHSVTAERAPDGRWRVVVDGQERWIDAHEVRPGTWSLLIDGRSYVVDLDRRKQGMVALHGASELSIKLEDARRKRLAEMAARGASPQTGALVIPAPIAGKVVQMLVAVGANVTAGQGVAVLEAMKMENEIRAPRDGSVTAVHVAAGQSVETQEPLLTLE